MIKRNKSGQFAKGNSFWLGKKRPDISREKNYNWNGGVIIQEGYRYLLLPRHPRAKSKKGYVAEHVLVMEAVLGRFLKPHEIVHHVDENKLNNKIGNLRLFKSRQEHLNYHAQKRVKK
jgi:hypothetical protein